MDAYSHRLAIARRFGVRIDAGDAVFMGSAPTVGLPCTVTAGEQRLISGMNSLMLLQVMKDQDWDDARFFTLDQVKQAGWELKPGAKKIGLQFLAATGADGMPVERPESLLFRVFNASEVNGVPEHNSANRSTTSDVEAVVRQAGINLGAQGLRSALTRMLASFESALSPIGVADRALRRSIAMTLVEAQTGPLGGPIGTPDAIQWSQQIAQDPISIYSAVRDAEYLAAQIMREVQAVTIERETLEELARSRASGSKAPAPKIQGADMARKAGATTRTEALFADRAAVLAVPFSEKTRASALGAVWYAPQSLWFVPAGLDITLFQEWNPRTHTLGEVATDRLLTEAFSEAMASLGLDTSKPVITDGKWHNVAVDSKDKRKNLSGSYIFTLDGARDGGAIGTINNKHTGEQMTWRYEGTLLTPEQRARFRQEALAREAQAAREMIVIQDAAAAHAAEIWDACSSADGNAYARKKGIPTDAFRQAPGSLLLKYAEFKSESGASAIRANQNYLIVPMSNDAGDIRAVQAISGDGSVKCFMRGAQKKGTMFILGSTSIDDLARNPVSAVAYVEGAATGVSFRAASDIPVVVCFDAGNMETIVKQTTSKLPTHTQRLIAVDNDQFFIERATGMLSEKLGLNPHAPGGQDVAIRAGSTTVRTLTLGEAVADGQWHQTARGSYCISLRCEADNEVVNSAVVEIIPTGARKMSATYQNRGLEAGKLAMQAVAESGKGSTVGAVMVVPEFKSLAGRPTDWNDLHKQEGIDAIRLLIPARIEADRTTVAATLRVGANRRLASLAR